MKQEPGPMADGLLSVPGSASSSFLSPDGGGSRSSPDGGGSGRPRRSGILMEALAKSNAALLADEQAQAGTTSAATRARASRAPVKAAATATYPRLFSWDAAVRLDLIKTSLLSQLGFKQVLAASPAEALVTGGPARLPLFSITDPAAAVLGTGGKGSLLQDQAAYVLKRASKRADRLAEIYSQMDDILPFWEAVVHITPANAPRTMELLQVAVLLSHSVVMQPKHLLACPRPSDIDFRILPMVDVPGHASFPSGHATAAYALTELLLLLLVPPPPPPPPQPPPAPKQARKSTRASARAEAGVQATAPPLPTPFENTLRRLAFRVAQNREVAGIHYPIDSVAGQLLGTVLAKFMEATADASSARSITGWQFDVAKLDEAASGEIARRPKTLDAAGLSRLKDSKITSLSAAQVETCPFMVDMWQASLAEVARLPLRYLK